MAGRNIAPAKLRHTQRGMERRATVRYPCNHQGSCHSIQPGPTSVYDATVFDMSLGGFSLVMNRPFETGEILAIELGNAPEAQRRKLFGRVLHAKSQPGVGWIIGCKFVKKLTAPQLNAIL